MRMPADRGAEGGSRVRPTVAIVAGLLLLAWGTRVTVTGASMGAWWCLIGVAMLVRADRPWWRTYPVLVTAVTAAVGIALLIYSSRPGG
jgi:hypothetical protein